jgi:hypothetical protein
LPNITGSIAFYWWSSDAKNNGCLQTFEQSKNQMATTGQAGVSSYFLNINASHSNPIYGSSSTVTPNSLITNFYISY